MTLAQAFSLSEDHFKKIVKSAARAANKDQQTLVERYKKMKSKKAK